MLASPLFYATNRLLYAINPPSGMRTYRSRSSARSSSTWPGTSTGLAGSLAASASEEEAGRKLANRPRRASCQEERRRPERRVQG